MTVSIKLDTKEWNRLRHAMADLPARVRKAQQVAALQEGHHYRKMVLKAFKTSGRSNGQGWAPNSKSTIANKKSSKPLIDRGDLRNSVVVVNRGRGRVFVGVSSKKRSSDGDRLVDIAEVHEFGRVIAVRVTRKMQKYLFAQLAKNGSAGGGGSGKFKVGQILLIRIPERSFLRATAEAHFTTAKVQRRMHIRIGRLLGGIWRHNLGSLRD